MPDDPLRRDFVDLRPPQPGELSATEYNRNAERTDDAFDVAVTAQTDAATALAGATGFVDFGFGQSQIGAVAYVGYDETAIRQVLDGIRSTGARRVRFAAWWGDIEQTAVGGTRTWTGLDRAFNLCEEYGLEPLLVITSPAPPSGTPTVATFASLCGAIAARYGSAGTGQLKYYQVWNEQNHTNAAVPFSNSPAQYAAILAAASPAIRTADPEAFIVTGGLASDSVAGGGVLPSDYLEDFYAAVNTAHFDALGFHWYSHDTAFTVWEEPAQDQDYFAELLACREIQIAAGDGATPFWVTEMGLPSLQVPDGNQRAAWLAKQVDMVHALPWVTVFFLYCYRDVAADGTLPDNTYGSVTFADFAKKQPQWDLLASVNASVKATVATGSVTVESLAADVLALFGVGGVSPYRANVGTGAPGPYPVPHNKGTRDFIPMVFRNPGHVDNDGNGSIVNVPVVPVDINNALIDTRETWALDQYRIALWPIPGGDVTPPTTVTLNEVSKTASAVSVAAIGATGAASYVWLRDGTAITRTAANTYTHTGLPNNTAAVYAVRAYDLMGNVVQSANVSITTAAASDTTAPTQPTATLSSRTSTTITIQASGGTDVGGIVGYHHWRGGVRITSTPVAAGNYTHTGLNPSTAYSCAVSAVDAAGNESVLSAAVAVTTAAAPDVTAPTQPNLPTLIAKTATTVTVNATGGSDAVGIVGQHHYRNSVRITTTPVTGNYQHVGLTSNTTYSFTVSNLDAAGNESPLSAPLDVTTDAPDVIAPTAPNTPVLVSKTATAVTMTLGGGTDAVGVTGYHVYRGGVKITSTPVAAGNYTDNGLAASTAYSYTATAVDAVNNESLQSSALSVTTDATSGPVTIIARGATNTRVTSTSTVTDSLVVPNGSFVNVRGRAAVVVSHSTHNPNGATLDSYTFTDSAGADWVLVGGATNGQFSGTQLGTVLWFERTSLAINATHNLSLTFAKAAMGTITSVQMFVFAAENVGSVTALTSAKATTGAISYTLNVPEGNLGVVAHASSGAIAGLNASPFVTERNTGGSATGTGDYMAVQSVPGAVGGGNRVFSSSGSQVWVSDGFVLEKAA